VQVERERRAADLGVGNIDARAHRLGGERGQRQDEQCGGRRDGQAQAA
jgi:hypothetical protein